MDIGIYREFMTLAAHKSFVSAARDLNMSQPSLSRHMNPLASDLGCQLFYDTRPLSLTAAGEVVLKHAGKIIGDQANMLAELQALPAFSNNRILILDLLHTNALYVGINKAITQAKERFPGLRIEFVNMDNSGLGGKQMIEAGKVDISFETVISEKPTTELDIADTVEAIWIPEFHGELVAGVSRTSPPLPSKTPSTCATFRNRASSSKRTATANGSGRISSPCASRSASTPTSRLCPPTTHSSSTPPTPATASTFSPRSTASTSR